MTPSALPLPLRRPQHPQNIVTLGAAAPGAPDGWPAAELAFPCDQAITDLVVACWLHGMPTRMSCQAIEARSGTSTVWLDFAGPSVERFCALTGIGGAHHSDAHGIWFSPGELEQVHRALRTSQTLAEHSDRFFVRPQTDADLAAEVVAELIRVRALVDGVRDHADAADHRLRNDRDGVAWQLDNLPADLSLQQRMWEAEQLVEDANAALEGLSDAIAVQGAIYRRAAGM